MFNLKPIEIMNTSATVLICIVGFIVCLFILFAMMTAHRTHKMKNNIKKGKHIMCCYYENESRQIGIATYYVDGIVYINTPHGTQVQRSIKDVYYPLLG